MDSALVVAVWEGKVAALADLLANQDKSHAMATLLDKGCLRIAAHCGHIAMADYLLSYGLAIDDITHFSKTTPLIEACSEGKDDMAAWLVRKGANVNCTNVTNQTALLWACHYNQTSLAKLLVAHGADVNASNRDGNTPLICAAWAGTLELVSFLLQHGADVAVTNKYHSDALRYACEPKSGGPPNEAICRVLLAAGARSDVAVGKFVLEPMASCAALCCLARSGADLWESGSLYFCGPRVQEAVRAATYEYRWRPMAQRACRSDFRSAVIILLLLQTRQTMLAPEMWHSIFQWLWLVHHAPHV